MNSGVPVCVILLPSGGRVFTTVYCSVKKITRFLELGCIQCCFPLLESSFHLSFSTFCRYFYFILHKSLFVCTHTLVSFDSFSRFNHGCKENWIERWRRSLVCYYESCSVAREAQKVPTSAYIITRMINAAVNFIFSSFASVNFT